MRIANLSGRLVLITADKAAPRRRPGQRRPVRPRTRRRSMTSGDAFTSWGAGPADLSAATPVRGGRTWDRPVPRPRQVFAIGLELQRPTQPSPASQVPGCADRHLHQVGFPALPGPVTEVRAARRRGTPTGRSSWVAVIGRLARNVSEADAWDHVCRTDPRGQDLSERAGQLAGAPPPQFRPGQVAARVRPDGAVARQALTTLDDRGRPGARLLDQRRGRCRRAAPANLRLLRARHGLGALPPSFPLLAPVDVLLHGHATPAGVGIGRDPQRLGSPPATSSSATSPAIGELRPALRPPPAPPPDPKPDRVTADPRGGHHHGPAPPSAQSRSAFRTWPRPAAYYTEFGLTPQHDGWFSHPATGAGSCGSCTRRCAGWWSCTSERTTPTTFGRVADGLAAAGDPVRPRTALGHGGREGDRACGATVEVALPGQPGTCGAPLLTTAPGRGRAEGCPGQPGVLRTERVQPRKLGHARAGHHRPWPSPVRSSSTASASSSATR